MGRWGCQGFGWPARGTQGVRDEGFGFLINSSVSLRAHDADHDVYGEFDGDDADDGAVPDDDDDGDDHDDGGG